MVRQLWSAGCDEETITSLAMDLMFGGVDNTTHSTIFALHLLATHPAIQEDLHTSLAACPRDKVLLPPHISALYWVVDLLWVSQGSWPGAAAAVAACSPQGEPEAAAGRPGQHPQSALPSADGGVGLTGLLPPATCHEEGFDVMTAVTMDVMRGLMTQDFFLIFFMKAQ